MDLTPNDIRNFEFPTQLRGFDKDAVEQFVEQVAEAMEALKQTNVKLSMELETTKGQLGEIKQFEDAIKAAAIDARRNADSTVATAKKEAEKILDEARDKAENIIKSNQHKLESIEKQLKQISDTRTSYLEKLQELMRSHLTMVESIEKNDAQAISPDEQINITHSTEVDESQKETLAQTDTAPVPTEEPAGKKGSSVALKTPADAETEAVDDTKATEELKKVLSEPEPAQEIDPELAEALQSYKKNTTQDSPDQPPQEQPAIPKQGEMVETNARAEDIPDGFVSNSDEPASENSTNKDSSDSKSGGIDLATELDNVAAKFEEEMDKAAKN